MTEGVERDLEIVRDGELGQCHMLEVLRIAHNLGVDTAGRDKRAAVRMVERAVAAGEYTVRVPETGSIQEIAARYGMDLAGFMQGVKKAMGDLDG